MSSRIQPAWRVAGLRTRQPTTIDELLDRVVVCPSGCWLWLGGTSRDPAEDSCQVCYGRILKPGTRRMMAAHRYVCETFNGPIPPGWQVDHICRFWAVYPKLSGLCVRPEHLEAVPHKINRARRDLVNGLPVTLDPSEYSELAILPGGFTRPRTFEDDLIDGFGE